MINNIFSTELTQALGWTMIHSLWQGFVVAILMGIAMIGLQKKSAKVRYELAWFALFLVLILSLSTFIYLYDSASSGEALGTTVSVITESGIILESGNTVQTFFQKTIAYFNEHLPLIVTLWFVGMFFFLLRLIGGLAYIEKLKSQKQNTLPEKWQQIFQNLRVKFPMKKSIRIVESSLAKVPMVIGYVKPVILFPMGAVNQLNEQEVEAVLAHELAHIYRNDYLLNIIQSLIETIFYYHPAVWWISANIRTERENCCDDIAVKLCGNSLTYVKALVSLEEMQPAPSLAMSFSSGRKNQLLNRVKRILNQPQNKFNIMEKFTATCFLLVALLLFSVSATQPDESKSESIIETVIEGQPHSEIIYEMEQDSIPKHLKGTGNFVYSKDGETIEVKYKNDEIVSLKINGEKIPNDEISDYETYLEKIMEDIPPPPAAPAPPVTPNGFAPTSPPAPPAPPHLDFYPSDNNTTVTEITNQNKKVVITQDEDGNTVIISDSYEEGENTHVVSGNGELSLNGRVIQMSELPLVFGDEDLKVDIPEIQFITEGGIKIHSFDSEELSIPSLAEIPVFLENFDLGNMEENKLSLFNEDDSEDLRNLFEESDEGHNLFEESDESHNLFDDEDFEIHFNDSNSNLLSDTIPGGNLWIKGNKVDWNDLSEEDRAKYKAELAEARKSMQKVQKELRKELAAMREINKEETKLRMKEAKEMQKQMKKEIREVVAQRREELELARQKINEAAQKTQEIRRLERGQWVSSIEEQLRKDDHIKSNGSYKFSFSDRRLKINGKKQSKSEWEKYKNIYEKTSGNYLGDDFKINISTDGKNNKNTSISISDNSN